MYITAIDIDMIEQILVHKGDIALCSFGLHGIILIEVKSGSRFENSGLLPYALRTSPAYTPNRGNAGCQAQHSFFTGRLFWHGSARLCAWLTESEASF